MRILRPALLLLVLAMAALACGPVGVAPAVAQDQAVVDYADWETNAQGAEDALAADRVSSQALEALRARIVAWRSTFATAQNANSAQIETVKAQIASLGPAPTEENPDAPEIAERRKALNEQLTRLQAPGLAAVEAYSRADGLIRQIDARIRARQASELLRLSPTPINPANWPAGLAVLTGGARTLWNEAEEAWSRSGIVTAVTDRAVFNATLDEPRAVDGWFAGGVLTWETGANAGRSIEVKGWIQGSGRIELFLPLGYAISSGDAFRVHPGCDKRLDTCIDRFTNVLNFRGEPYVPGQDAMMSYPDAR